MVFQIDSEDDFKNVEWLFVLNIMVLILGYYWVFKLEIPNNAKLNMKSTWSINIEKETEFLNESLSVIGSWKLIENVYTELTD